MGFFDFLNKGKDIPQSTQAPSSTENHAGLNLSKEEATQKLNLRKEKFELCLTKKSLNNVVARVCVVMDKSGSMRKMYQDGTVQSVIERILPSALKFDDNGELEVWLFDDDYVRMPSVTEADFHGYVNEQILDRHVSFGGTEYAPVINDVVKKYVREDPSNIPTFVIFITDGENSDKTNARRAIVEASRYNIFWQFIGIGREDFKFLKSLDEMEGRFVDNANFFEVNHINSISDEQLYDQLLNEFPAWINKAKELDILK